MTYSSGYTCYSTLRPEQFQKEDHANIAINSINTNLSEIIEIADTGFLEEVWGTIEEVIQMRQCEVYSYIPDMVSLKLSSRHFFVHTLLTKPCNNITQDADPFTDGTL